MNYSQFRASDFMQRSVITFAPDTPLLDALAELVRREISGAPVIDDQGNVVGILTERDCITKVIQSGYYAEAAGRVSEFMSKEVTCVDAAVSLMDVAKSFATTPYRRFPVLKDNQLVGLISRRDVLRAILR